MVARKEASAPVHHAVKPAVVAHFDDVDDRPLLEGELIVFATTVAVNGHH